MSNLRDRKCNVKPERFCFLRSCFGGGRDILVGFPDAMTRHVHPAPLPAAVVHRVAACVLDRNAPWPTTVL